MPRLLVTGGAGFIGANFVHYWFANYPDDHLVVLDALTYAGNMANLEPVRDRSGYRFVKGDIGDQQLVEEILLSEKIDTIVNFAAESHVDRSILGPDAFVATNVVGTHNLLKAARKIWLDGAGGRKPHRFHHVSTDEIYGSLGPDDHPFTESTPYAPNSPYSASKASADHLVRAYHHTYGLEVSTSSCSNNYGPYQFPEKLIPLIIINILHGKALPIYGDGLNIRDWLYVDDHCRGIDLILKKGRVGEVYNIGGNNEWTNIDIVRLVCNLLDEALTGDLELAKRFPDAPANKGKKAEELITFVKDRLGHDRRYAIDATKCREELGYVPTESFETGIRKTIAWYLANEKWWQTVMDGSYRDWLEKQYV
ncbi:MAG: dTDP-glucose 4,6-dehydratase [Desulfobulbaceae bacterium]|nr:dTDP-glucose 4,6-dehydratase [Desulfobulbaceae bacterium]HIJ77971.1 dTDP-glucose 4,6-dehydratase [Deltaproteobacteria bacterium]